MNMADTRHFVRADVQAFLGLVNSLPAPEGPPDPEVQRQGRSEERRVGKECA